MKYLIVLVFLSLTLNIYLFNRGPVEKIVYQKTKSKPIQADIVKNQQSSISKSIKQNSECEVSKKTLKAALATKNSSISNENKTGKEEAHFDASNYEEAREKEMQKFRHLMVEDLEISEEDFQKIVEMIKQREKSMDDYFNKRIEEKKAKYGEAAMVYFEPEDHIYLGEEKIKTRNLMRAHLGVETYNRMLELINQGKADSEVGLRLFLDI
jgi:phosphatidate phosphatase PAH1